MPKCPRCHKGGYTQSEAPDGRPLFTCGACNHNWTNGHDGGEYRILTYRIESSNGVTTAGYKSRKAAQAAADRVNRAAPGGGWHVVPESEYPR